MAMPIEATKRRMGDIAASPLVRLLRQPDSAASLPGWAWTQALAHARAERLGGPLAARLMQAGLTEDLDPRVRRHLLAEHRIAERRDRVLRWETHRVAQALSGVGTRIALLKGAAYALSGLPLGAGRTSSDVDILVPRSALDAVETALLAQGWRHLKMSVYDQRYYRAYMHELPPLLHTERRTVLDVHHTIAPLTSRLAVPDPLLWRDAEPVPGTPFVCPNPAVLTLHAAIHLFHDGEITGSFRDLVDLDGLMRHFSARPGYWQDLLTYAGHAHLGRPLFYAARYARSWLDTPIPTEIDRELQPYGPPAPLAGAMDHLIASAFAPASLIDGRSQGGFARWLLYVRSHWLRMPVRLLSYHLVRKAVRRVRDRLSQRSGQPGFRLH